MVQLGFGGFVAAMAVLSYWLMVQEGNKAKPNRVVYEHIQRYAKYTLYLSLIVILGSIVSAVRDLAVEWFSAQARRELRQTATLSRSAQNCREALTGLISSEGTGRTLDQLGQVQRSAHDVCFDVMRGIEDLESDRYPDLHARQMEASR